MADVHVNIRIIGIVQGVGFRPFVYKKALENFISGFVFNDTEGVYIEAEGTSQNIEKFISAIKADPPLLAQMYTVICDEAPLVGYNSFEIRNSQEGRKRTVFYSPDTNICDDCLTEFNNTNDRRYHYPFITCINCGPRFSIIADVPYDRACTSMNTFNMCDDCEREYNDPFNRRHHTQPNGCPRCGPLYAMYDNQGKKLSDSIEDIITKVLEEISCGKILAIKSMGGYHLVANASNDKVIETLRQRKYRPFKPFAVMCGSISKVKEMCYVNSIEEKLLLSKERPIVLLKIKALSVAHNVAPGLTYLGVMLPYTPFHHLLFTKDSDLVLVMTSGNVTDEPIVYEDEDAEQRLSFIADFFVSYNRKIVIQSDDSVYFEALNKPLCIRRSRGYVPIPFRGKEKVSPILAMGGDLKNCFAITKEHYYIMSQYFGDMADPLTIKAFQKNLAHYSKIFEFTPEVVVTDLHPGYITTQEASKYNTQKLQVQHHYAHALAVMEEHDLSEPVIAIIYDGTGFGLDGHIWGSEIFTADQNNFERKAHYSYFPLPGGDRAVKDVWRI